MAEAIVCSIAGCCNPRYTKKSGFCRAHYLRNRRHGEPLGGSPSHAPAGEPLDWINRHLDHKGQECLIWPYGKTGSGYGVVYENSVMHLAHRWVCEKVCGPPDADDLQCAHSCGNGHLGCVNPNHLRWASIKENCADRDSHGRQFRGEGAPNSILSEGQVLEIQRLKGSEETALQVARKFCSSPSTIYDIWKGRTWAWLTEEKGES